MVGPAVVDGEEGEVVCEIGMLGRKRRCGREGREIDN